jgi:hypothetical protein
VAPKARPAFTRGLSPARLLAALQEAQVVLELGLLLEIEEARQAGDEGADVRPQRGAQRAQLEDAALDFVGPPLGQLEELVRLQLGLLDVGLGLPVGRLADVVRGLLGGQERALEDTAASSSATIVR